MSHIPPPPLLSGKLPRIWLTPKGTPYLTQNEDPRRYTAPTERLTDEEIAEEADREAHRADHDNKCAREAGEGIEL